MKRNRPLSESRIVEAASDMIAERGFADFGVNSLSARVGLDKVLIYRYFGGIDGVLAHLAEGCVLMPRPLDMLDGDLRGFLVNLQAWLHAHPLTVQLMQWESLVDNALTTAMQENRRVFWDEVGRLFKPADEAAKSFLQLLPLLPLYLPRQPAWEGLLNSLVFDVVQPVAVPEDRPMGIQAPASSPAWPPSLAAGYAADALPTELL